MGFFFEPEIPDPLWRGHERTKLIRRTLSPKVGRCILAALPAPGTVPGRMAFVREVCTTFRFCDLLGHLHEADCLAAFRDLAHVGVLTLPLARRWR